MEPLIAHFGMPVESTLWFRVIYNHLWWEWFIITLIVYLFCTSQFAFFILNSLIIHHSFIRGLKVTCSTNPSDHRLLLLIELLSWTLAHFRANFCRAMRCISAAYAVMQCLSVCLSVCLSRSWVVSKRIKICSKFFSSPHHSSFSVPNGMAIFRREPP